MSKSQEVTRMVEGVCAYRFLLDQYDKPWRSLLSAYVHTSHHGVQYRAFKEYLAKNEWPKWPSTRFEMRTEHCGCGHYASLFNPFGPRDFWHQVMTWWMGQFLMPRDLRRARSSTPGSRVPRALAASALELALGRGHYMGARSIPRSALCLR